MSPQEIMARAVQNGEPLFNPNAKFNNPRDMILNWDLKKMSEYVDVVTKYKVDNKHEAFLLENLAPMRAAYFFEEANATSVGNLAYMALYGSKKVKELSNEFFTELKDFINEKRNRKTFIRPTDN